MKITKGKNDNWCIVYGRKFKIEEFDPNLRKTAKKFLDSVDPEDFLARLKKYTGIKPKAPIIKTLKVKAVHFGGCWNIRTLDDKLILIHDPEISEKERNRRK